AAESMCALRQSGEVYCWGSNGAGLLGDGPDAAAEPLALQPVPVAALSNVVQIAVGAQEACAVRGDGSVVCWGSLAGRVADAGTAVGLVPVPGIQTASKSLSATATRARDCAMAVWSAGGTIT